MKLKVIRGGNKYVRSYANRCRFLITRYRTQMIKHPAKKTIYLRRIAQKERRIKLCRGYWRKPEIRRIRRRVVYKNVPRRVIRRVRTNSCSNLRTVILKLQGELLKTVDPKKKASIEKRIIKLELQTKGEKYLKELNDKHKRNKSEGRTKVNTILKTMRSSNRRGDESSYDRVQTYKKPKSNKDGLSISSFSSQSGRVRNDSIAK